MFPGIGAVAIRAAPGCRGERRNSAIWGIEDERRMEVRRAPRIRVPPKVIVSAHLPGGLRPFARASLEYLGLIRLHFPRSEDLLALQFLRPFQRNNRRIAPDALDVGVTVGRARRSPSRLWRLGFPGGRSILGSGRPRHQ